VTESAGLILTLFVEVKIMIKLMRVMVIVLVAAVAVAMVCESAVAQDQRGRGGGGDRGPGGRGGGDRGPGGGDRGPGGMGGGGFDVERMTEMRMERFRDDEVLGFSEEEWTVISPLLKGVLMKQTEAFSRGFGGRGRGPDAEQDQSKEPIDMLRAALEDEKTPSEKIEALLKKHRADLKKKQEDLKKAQAELKDVLSIRQEAYLVTRGILE
jgi:hypothetical protein